MGINIETQEHSAKEKAVTRKVTASYSNQKWWRWGELNPRVEFVANQALHVYLIQRFTYLLNQQAFGKYMRLTEPPISVVFKTTTSLPSVLRHVRLRRSQPA
jgi:hypothetical protein